MKRNTNPPAKIDDIISFEKEFNINLPQSYKKFLLENDGGEIDESPNGLGMCSKFINSSGEIMECYLSNFKSLIKIKESLIHLLKRPDECFYLDECMKRGALIIGFETQLEISIGINEDNFGKVYRSNFTEAWNNNQLQLISNTFEDFINSFEEEEDW